MKVNDKKKKCFIPATNGFRIVTRNHYFLRLLQHATSKFSSFDIYLPPSKAQKASCITGDGGFVPQLLLLISPDGEEIIWESPWPCCFLLFYVPDSDPEWGRCSQSSCVSAFLIIFVVTQHCSEPKIIGCCTASNQAKHHEVQYCTSEYC